MALQAKFTSATSKNWYLINIQEIKGSDPLLSHLVVIASRDSGVASS
jgi:hypothetical protein